MAYRSRAHRHPAHPPPPARAPPRPGERGVTVWDGDRRDTSHSMCENAERNESRPAHKSGSRAPTDRSTALITSAPSLPTHPPRPGPRRAISGDLALSRAISGPRRAISGDLGASLARRHTCSKSGLVGRFREGGDAAGVHPPGQARGSRAAPPTPAREGRSSIAMSRDVQRGHVPGEAVTKGTPFLLSPHSLSRGLPGRGRPGSNR